MGAARGGRAPRAGPGAASPAGVAVGGDAGELVLSPHGAGGARGRHGATAALRADGNQDPLVARASFADPAYTAFVRAVRGLPEQQAEAYLLYHGERLNERLLGVAMDCSAAAAANHLQAATDALTAMSGGDLSRCTAHPHQGLRRPRPRRVPKPRS